MKIIKPLTLGVLNRPYRHRGRHRLAVVALGFFPLGQGALARLLIDNLQWAKLVPQLPVGQPLDLILPKARAEVMLSGSAHSAEPVQRTQVRLQCGAVDKRLNVIGDRQWRRRWWPTVCVDDAAPFTTLPLDYARAYGGAGHDNPLGCGYLPRLSWFRTRAGKMPNLEYPGLAVAPGRRGLPAAGFAPRLLQHAEEAMRRSGTYDARWLAEDFPGLPRDFDFGLFNLAPVDQQLDAPLTGDETYCLEGLHPTHPKLEGSLPGVRARAFVLREGQTPEQAEEVALACDTAWFFPDQDIGMVAFRGECEVADSDALDVQALMVAYETLGATRPLVHYREVMGLRLDAQTAPLHAFNESQLTPPRGAEEIAARLARREAEARAAQAARQARLDEHMAALWQSLEASGMGKPADYEAPQAPAPLIQGPGAEALAEGEFDLAELLAQARALADQAQAEAAALKVEQEARLAEFAPPIEPDADAIAREAIARASEVAHDLVGGAPTPGLPAALKNALALAQAQPEGMSAEQAAEIEAALATAAALAPLQRAQRVAAPTPTVPALPAAAAQALGAQVRQWIADGVALAGRDLAGVDLSGVDLSGADLREVRLEHADLRGAKLVGAKLDKAALTAARLDEADLSGAVLDGANLSGGSARGAKLRGASLRGARASDADWRGADLAGACLDDLIAPRLVLEDACLDDTRCARSVFSEARAAGSRWRHTAWSQTVAHGIDLAHADFGGAKLERAVLLDARLTASNWQGAELASTYGGGKADWSGADLRGARLRRCGLQGAQLRGARLDEGIFAQTDFGRADLSDASLEGARFYRSLFMQSRLRRVGAARADFFQALCRKADFGEARLQGAVLAQADLAEAVMDGARLERAHVDRQARLSVFGGKRA